MRRHAQGFIAVVALGAAACSPETIVQYQYDPYEGDAYPNRQTPVAVPHAGMGIVSDSLSDTLSLIDMGTGDRIASVPVGRDPAGIDGPHHVALDVKHGAVFIALSYPVIAASGPHAQHGSSVQSGYAQKLALSDFRILGQVRVDNNPGDIVLSEDGKRLVVSHFDLPRVTTSMGDPDKARATLAVIEPTKVLLSDSADPKRIKTCAAPHAVALSRPDGARAFVACYGEDALAIVDLDAGALIERVPLGPEAGPIGAAAIGPYAAVLSPDGALVAIGNTVSKDVRFFDVATNKVLPNRTLPTLGVPYFAGFSPDGGRLYVPIQKPDALVVVDLNAGNAEVASRYFSGDECVAPHLAELVGDEVFVVCEGDHKTPGRIVRLDANNLATMSSAEVGVYPDALARVTGGAP